MKSLLIVVEGPQGVGKTTVTDAIRHQVPYTNLYRLYGTKDKSPTGLIKAEEMYDILMNYVRAMENKDINLLFDRTFFTEEVYARLGYKEYSFTKKFRELLQEFDKLDYEIYYITLYLNNVELYRKRLDRGEKAKVKYVEFNIQNSIDQQNTYLELAKEIEETTKNIHVINLPNDEENMAFNEIKRIISESNENE